MTRELPLLERSSRRSTGPTRSWGLCRLVAALAVLAVLAASCSDDDSSTEETTTGASESSTTVAVGAEPPEDRAYYILPPGNYGGLPANENTLDQLPLYDGLTPLRGDVTDKDIEELFLPEDFAPIGETFEEPTPREGTSIVYDEFGVAHVTGETREDMAFGAGWVTARDRGLLVELGRGPARAAVADIPGIDPFSWSLVPRSSFPARQPNSSSPIRSI